MADEYRASPLSVRLSQEDREWLAKRADDEDVSVHALIRRAVEHFRYWQEEGEEALKEALEIFEAERSGHDDERRRRLYFQREYDVQSRRLHDMLRDERHRRWEQEKQLRDERDLRAERESRLRDERDYYERQAKAAEAYRNALYGPTIAKLLTLAIRSESDGEATAAFAKARALHRARRYSRSDTR
jgi:predicted transcriptional regulator